MPGYHNTHPNTEGYEKEGFEAMGVEHKFDEKTTEMELEAGRVMAA